MTAKELLIKLQEDISWLGYNETEREIVSHIQCAIELLKEQQEAETNRLKRPDCEHAEHDGLGCLGYCKCKQDDEPIEICKNCEKYTGNISESRLKDD